MCFYQRGQSYIELAVALLLMSISLTGMVASILSAQQLSRHSAERYDIALLLSNISNELHLNKAEADRDQSYYLTAINKAKTISINCSAKKDCPQRLQALRDLKQWQGILNNSLSAYSMVMCRDSTMHDGEFDKSDGCDNKNSSPLVIKLWWKSQHTDETHFYVLEHRV